MFLGIDIGSSSTKAALLDENMKLCAVAVINLGTGTKAHEAVVKDVLGKAGITEEDIKYSVVTGYGRVNYQKADKQITEITCHARGVKYFVDDAKTIIDIGGQDAKVIKLSDAGKVQNFVMNEKCAAGTGRFLEVMARVFGCELGELSELADMATKDVFINNVCTVFAESEVISRLSAGEEIADVAKGAHVAIAKRVVGMCNRLGYEPKIVMTGGVALNSNMVQALSKELDCDIHVFEECQAAGAIGAAAFAYEIYKKKS